MEMNSFQNPVIVLIGKLIGAQLGKKIPHLLWNLNVYEFAIGPLPGPVKCSRLHLRFLPKYFDVLNDVSSSVFSNKILYSFLALSVPVAARSMT